MLSSTIHGGHSQARGGGVAIASSTARHSSKVVTEYVLLRITVAVIVALHDIEVRAVADDALAFIFAKPEIFDLALLFEAVAITVARADMLANT